MRENFDNALEWVLTHEGGFVDHPEDPGGATMQGVTQRVYDGFRRRMGDPIRPVKRIETHELRSIYRAQYWDVVMGDALPGGLDYAVFDYAVNSGPAQAVRDLQRVLGVAVDGIMGNVTLGAAQEAASDYAISNLCRRRMDFLRQLRTWGTFGRGWTRRVMGRTHGVQSGDVGVIDRACKLADGETPPPPPLPIEAEGKGDPADKKKRVKLMERLATPEGIGTVSGSLGTVLAAVSDNMILSAAVAAAVVLLAGVVAWRMMR